MKFKVDEITSVIQQEIGQYEAQLDVTQMGRVIEVGDGIARIYGLRGAMAGEMLDFGDGNYRCDADENQIECKEDTKRTDIDSYFNNRRHVETPA